jgi:hypothetical protein
MSSPRAVPPAPRGDDPFPLAGGAPFGDSTGIKNMLLLIQLRWIAVAGQRRLGMHRRTLARKLEKRRVK